MNLQICWHSRTARKWLLLAGIASVIVYGAGDLASGLLYDGYSYRDQWISELTAFGSPVRPLMVTAILVHGFLLLAFGVGIWRSADRRSLRWVGVLLILAGAIGLPTHTAFAMSSRWMTPGFNDAMHATFSIAFSLIVFAAVALSAAAYPGWFRLYSIATIPILMGFGAASAVAIQGIEQNSTPWAGGFERINAYAYFAWLIVLAVTVMRRSLDHQQSETDSVIRAFGRRHPVVSYYALVFAVSWGGILALVAPGGIPGEPDDVARLFPFTLVALFAGPSIAGVVLTALVSGKTGLRELLARGLRWRVGPAWWAAALLTGPALVAGVLFGLSLHSSDFVPGLLTTDDKLGLLIFGIAWGLVGGGLLEELGWTGFAVPTLRQRYRILTTGLIVGLLWGTWHLLIAFWASRGLAGEAPLAGFIAGFLAFYFVALPAYRVLMVWLYDHTGSLLLAMLMHAVLSASTLILQPVSAHGQFTWHFLLGAALWAVVVVVAILRPGVLLRPPVPPAVPQRL